MAATIVEDYLLIISYNILRRRSRVGHHRDNNQEW